MQPLMPKTKFVIGLDFDNTLVSYDEAMYQTALELDFISGQTAVHNKQQVRDYLRALPAGELQWQKLQAEVYGKRMNQARLMDGVERFFRTCKDDHIPTFIVSHKSKYAAQDQEKVNLQEAALIWMRQNHFFDKDGLGLAEDRIYFEDSREKKVLRIKELGCGYFVDDLQEVFLEKNFPQETVRMLFSPANGHDLNVGAEIVSGIKVFRSWDDIYNYFFVK